MVRQAIFNLVGHDLTDLRVLDLFCGSGALGLEAASRGAASVILVDKAREAVACATDNMQTLGAANARVLASDAVVALASLPADCIDLALCDPPYAYAPRQRLLEALHRVVAPGGTLVFETADKDALAEADPDWERQRTRAYGSTALHVLVRR